MTCSCPISAICLSFQIPRYNVFSSILSRTPIGKTDTDNVIRLWHAPSCAVTLPYTALSEVFDQILRSQPLLSHQMA